MSKAGNISTAMQFLPMGSYKQSWGENSTWAGLNSTVGWGLTPNGLGFVTVGIDLYTYNRSDHWDFGTFSLVYFQIEEPSEKSAFNFHWVEEAVETDAEEGEGEEEAKEEEAPKKRGGIQQSDPEDVSSWTGVGFYEGWIGILGGKGNRSGEARYSAVRNISGRRSLENHSANVTMWGA